MTQTATSIVFPIGRLVQGSLYKAQDKDQQGNPRVVKTGVNAGKPNPIYFFAVAYAKSAADGGHWANTEWGKQIWAVGHAGFPNGQAQAPSFAWKVEDGDSIIPNKKGRKNAEREGFPGHWVVNFSSSFAPKIYTADGSAPIIEADAVKLGYYVQVLGSVLPNGNGENPGVYMNHNMIAFSGYGAEIHTGPDPKAVGFGKGVAAPAGMSAAPVGGASFPVTPGAPAAPGAPVPAPAAPPAPVAAPAAPAPAPTAVAPHPGFAAPVAPGAPPAPPAAPPAGPKLTAKAGNHTYAQLVAAGWTDDTLRAHGYLA